MGGRLNELLVQQMSGRAGRRGLDTQGHLVFAGASAAFVRRMMVHSRIPEIAGRDPRHIAMFLQEMCSKFSNPVGFPRQTDMILAGQSPSCEFVHSPVNLINMRDISRNLLVELGFIEQVEIMTVQPAIGTRCKAARRTETSKSISIKY